MRQQRFARDPDKARRISKRSLVFAALATLAVHAFHSVIAIKEGNLARGTFKKSSGELANVLGDDQELIAVHAHDEFTTYRTDEFYRT